MSLEVGFKVSKAQARPSTPPSLLPVDPDAEFSVPFRGPCSASHAEETISKP